MAVGSGEKTSLICTGAGQEASETQITPTINQNPMKQLDPA
jgi:hypothetical protein